MKLEIFNPFNRELLADFPLETELTINEKIKTAQAAFQQWKRVDLFERIEQVRQALNYFTENQTQIARDITNQMGKPLHEAMGEVKTMLGRTERCLQIAQSSLQPDLVAGDDNLTLRIEHEPLGLVFDIAAWNYPLLIPVNVIVPALLAGNVVLLKHSAKTPLCGIRFERAFASMSISGTVTNLILSHEQTASLVQDERIDHVSFTGSVPGGRSIYKAVGESRFIDVGLELGGNDVAWVAEDADLEFTVPNVVEGALYNSGQSCCAVERVYVHQNCYNEFLERAEEEIKKWNQGDPLLKDIMMGPLASRSAAKFLSGQCEEAISLGGKLVCGGKVNQEPGPDFFAPTLLKDVPNQTQVMQEESFGPILPVQVAANDQEAVKLMNDNRFGLTASVWTPDRERAEWMSRELNAGTIFQNRCDFLEPGLPWTGYGDSGKGSTLSRFGFYHLTRRKSIHFREIK